MAQEFQKIAELQAFNEAQQKTIIQLSKKIKALEEEKTHLKKLLESSVPVIQSTPQKSDGLETNDEETIALTQLRKLRDISLERELTLEEAKRCEIFFKILNASRNAPKTIEIKSKKLNTTDLLALVESEVDVNTEDK